MKKSLLIIIILFATAKLFGQAIINGGFESWDSTGYSQPVSWYTTNGQSIQQVGAVNVTEVTGYSGNAVHMQTIISAGDTDYSAIGNATLNDYIFQGKGGQPYTQKSTGFTGYYRCNIMNKDSAMIIVIFKKSGTIIGNYMYKITGSQSAWTSFNYTFTPALTTTPDSVVMAAVSSNAFRKVGVQSGSWLELDQLAFTGPNTTIPGGNFDTWNNLFYYTPDGWSTGGGLISRTTNSYKGKYAISLVTVSGGKSGSVNNGYITNGKAVHNNGPQGGQPYTLTQDTLVGYYQYTTSANDSAGVQINLTKNGSGVGGGSGHNLGKTNGWTYFEIPFGAFSTPDTLSIAFWSSNDTMASALGSTLILDDIQLKSQPLGIFNLPEVFIQNTVYPVPSKDLIHIQLTTDVRGIGYLYVYDMTGRIVKEDIIPISSNLLTINIADMQDGMYMYKIIAPAGRIIHKFIKD